MNSLPTVVREPVFEKLFQQNLEHENTALIQAEAQKLRDQAVDILSTPSNLPDVSTLPVGLIFSHLDEMFNLKDKYFNTVSTEIAANSLPKSTSSAFPDFKKKGDLLDSNINDVNCILAERDLSWMEYPSIVRWRTQQRKSGRKFRQFYMFGYRILTLEMIYAKPFFDHFQMHKDTPYCFANIFPDLAKKISSLRHFKYGVSIDYTSYDQRCTASLMYLAFKYLKSKLRLNNYTKRLFFDKIVEYSVGCSIATKYHSTPIMFSKARGVMSGSVFTNLIGSIINAIMISYYFIQNKQLPTKNNVLVMGDDCLFGFDSKVNLNELFQFMKTNFDAEVSIEKSEVYNSNAESFYFLGYDINENGRWANFELMKRQLIFSEQFIPESVMPTKTRLFSKLASILFKCTWLHILG
jgi:hypothetical protein